MKIWKFYMYLAIVMNIVLKSKHISLSPSFGTNFSIFQIYLISNNYIWTDLGKISLIFAVLLCTRLNLCLRRLPRDWIKFKIRPYPLRTCEKFKNDVISNLDILRNSSVRPKSPPFSHLTVSQQIRNRVSDSNLNLNRV